MLETLLRIISASKALDARLVVFGAAFIWYPAVAVATGRYHSLGLKTETPDDGDSAGVPQWGVGSWSATSGHRRIPCPPEQRWDATATKGAPLGGGLNAHAAEAGISAYVPVGSAGDWRPAGPP